MVAVSARMFVSLSHIRPDGWAAPDTAFLEGLPKSRN